jgi:2-polyprenyl-3-methyl-5-hydroxy-6-metoxy-1,4-benzoquinol methylase
MSDNNSETLRSYEARVTAYTEGTSQTVHGPAKAWIDSILNELQQNAKILEIGSAHGRDAIYFREMGFKIECTDAVSGFVSQLRASGFDARLFNVLSDELNEKYDLIFANAVLLHFDRSEFILVLRKLRSALKHGGQLAFSLKQGRGEAWSREKIDAPRYFSYWERENLEPLLAATDFTKWTIEESHTGRAHAEWLFVTAYVE